jgi:hypothetical protein
MAVRFRVVEWRSRFRMAFDPPTHQAWVILRGAPLQVWTRYDISCMLQCFGYPLHIEPFALPSGQFIEIMVLVACDHPRMIPHMLMLHEGNHVALVLVYLHRWRLWRDDPFFPHYDPAMRQQRWNHQFQVRRHRPSPPSSTRSSATHRSMSTNYSALSPRNLDWATLPPKVGNKVWVPKKKQVSSEQEREVQTTEVREVQRETKGKDQGRDNVTELSKKQETKVTDAKTATTKDKDAHKAETPKVTQIQERTDWKQATTPKATKEVHKTGEKNWLGFEVTTSDISRLKGEQTNVTSILYITFPLIPAETWFKGQFEWLKGQFENGDNGINI